MNKYSSLFGILVLGLLSACTHMAKKAPREISAGGFWQEQVARKGIFQPVTGKVSVHWEGNNESVTGQGRLVSDYPSPFRMEMRDPLGKMQLLVVLTGANFVAYYPTRNMAYVDKTSGLSFMKKNLGLHASLEDVQALMLGMLPTRWKVTKFDSWGWDETLGSYVGKMKQGETTLDCEADGNTGALRKIRWRGSETLEVEYANFHWIHGLKAGEGNSGAHLAYSIAIKSPDRKALIEVEWQNAQVLPQKLEMSALEAVLPPSTKVTRLD